MSSTELPLDVPGQGDIGAGAPRASTLRGSFGTMGNRLLTDPRLHRFVALSRRIGTSGLRGVMMAVRCVRPLGWSVVAVSVVAWLLGVELGWAELLTVATVGVCALALCSLFLLGGAVVDMEVELRPARVTAGERASGHLVITNRSESRVLPVRVDLPVGASMASFQVPSLRSGESHEELFQIPTTRRAVIQVGPARIVRADPIGLLSRLVSEAKAVTLFVHPVTIRVSGMSTGFLRDLEGRESANLSPSDLAFHSLREYTPGDDRRHIHWKTTARTGRLMVQQFVDTRRAHVLIVLDLAPSAYRDEDEFEMAVSIVGSVGMQAILDSQRTTVVAGYRVLPSNSRNQLLDQLSAMDGVDAPARFRGIASSGELSAAARLGARSARAASITLMVTGRNTTMAELRAASRRFSLDSRVVAIRVGGDQQGYQVIENMSNYDMRELDQLPSVVASGMG